MEILNLLTSIVFLCLLLLLSYTETSEAVVRHVHTSKEFGEVLDKVEPGDIIKLSSSKISFRGRHFRAAKNGKPNRPITITGSSVDGGGIIRLKLGSNANDRFNHFGKLLEN